MHKGSTIIALSRLVLALCALAIPQCVAAQSLSLGAPFSDGIVLQRGKPIPVWGNAPPGATIKISLGAEEVVGTADFEGNWRIDLPPMAARESLSLIVSSDAETVTLANVAVGDVFLCSGQSNMEFPMSETALGEGEHKVPIDARLRLLKVPLSQSQIPQESFARPVAWRSGQEDTLSFSSICLLFGREIAREKGIVVGLLNSSFGGTPVEGWMNRAAMVHAGGMEEHVTMLDDYAANPVAAEEEYGKTLERYWTRKNSPWRSRMGFANLYNAMIAPLGPMRFAGVLWYQGENNANGGDTLVAYRDKLTGLLAGWRAQFGEDLPFIIFQISSFGQLATEAAPSSWAEIREAQRQVALADPRSALVVTIDVGERFDIHPPVKRPVALRASRAAFALVYGDRVDGFGPQPRSAHRAGRKIEIDFAHVDTALFAASWGRPGPFQLCNESAPSCAYADAVFSGGGIIVDVPEGFAPMLVRYCWAAAPICNVFDGAQQPLVPFELSIDDRP